MADKNIKITVMNRRAILEGSPVIICGNSGYTVTFSFDDEWDLTGVRTARFVYVKAGEVQHEDKVFDGNVVEVPILADVSFVKVGVFAGDLCTTTPARINCESSILCGSGAVHEPTPDVYSQIMALFNEMAHKGAFGATEEQMQQVAANAAGIEALKKGTAKAGDAEKFGGQLPAYYATAESVANIQTTARANLSTAGWYRVAEFQGDKYTIKGSSANGCIIVIKRTYTKQSNEMYRILLDSTHGSQEFNIQSAKANVQAITKIRYTYDATTNKAYIEIYYNANVADYVRVYITEPLDSGNKKWASITGFEPTSETVDGVTVTATYDIPNKAKPVTDLDIAGVISNDTYAKKINATSTLTEDPDTTTLPRIRTKHANCPTSSATYIIDTIYTDGTSEVNEKFQIARGTGSDVYLGFRAKAYNKSWGSWYELTTTADLANYFKNTGGAIDGDVTIKSDSAVYRTLKLLNSLRDIRIRLSDAGTFQIIDVTNNKTLFSSKADGSSDTLYATASGNLPLTGGTVTGDIEVVKNSSSGVARLKATNGDISIGLMANGNGNIGLYDYGRGSYLLQRDINGDTIVNGTASENLPKKSPTVQASGGDYGGQMFFELSPNSGLNTGVRTENYLNTFRIMEVGGNARGAFLDLTKCSNGGTSEIHHDGNSKKIVVSSTPITDENSVRIW